MQYQGHHCRNCWNVALWIDNDEGLYRFALECKRRPGHDGKAPSLGTAATRFLDQVNGKTPDGAKYTRAAVVAALAGLE